MLIKAVLSSLDSNDIPSNIFEKLIGGFGQASQPAFKELCIAQNVQLSSPMYKKFCGDQDLSQQMFGILDLLESKYQNLSPQMI